MINNKIIEISEKLKYYVIENIEYKGKKYILTTQYDENQNTINENEYHVMELDLENNNLKIKQIKDKNIANIVIKKLIEKTKNQ